MATDSPVNLGCRLLVAEPSIIRSDSTGYYPAAHCYLARSLESGLFEQPQGSATEEGTRCSFTRVILRVALHDSASEAGYLLQGGAQRILSNALTSAFPVNEETSDAPIRQFFQALLVLLLASNVGKFVSRAELAPADCFRPVEDKGGVGCAFLYPLFLHRPVHRCPSLSLAGLEVECDAPTPPEYPAVLFDKASERRPGRSGKCLRGERSIGSSRSPDGGACGGPISPTSRHQVLKSASATRPCRTRV